MVARKEDRRVKITKLLLKKSLIDLLYQKNINKITIKELCEMADLNRSTFYAHYTDAYDLLDNIKDAYMKNIIKEVPIMKLKYSHSDMVIKNILNYILDNKKLSKLLLGEKGEVTFQKRLMSIVYDDLQDMLLKIENISEEQAKFISSYIITGSIGVLQNWIENDFHQPVAIVSEVIGNLTKTIMISLNEESIVIE